MTTVEQWREFLKRWSDEWLETDTKFASAVRAKRWLGHAAASEGEIAAAEKRLGYRLPPSYRAFLLTSNGWRKTSALIERVRPIQKARWLEDEEPELLEAMTTGDRREPLDGLSAEEYFTYDGRPFFDFEHFRKSLKIADPVPGDSLIYVLNPQAVTEDGEWEAWLFAHWIPGAERFPSFAHLMRSEYQTFCVTKFGAKPREVRGPFEGVSAPDRARTSAVRIGAGAGRPRRLTLEEMVEQLQSPQSKARKEAAKKLSRQFKPRAFTELRPRLVEPLTRVLGSDVEAEVRAAAALALGSYGDQRAIEPLVRALGDRERDVSRAAVSALHYLSIEIKDPRIAEGLYAYLEGTPDLLYAAGTAMHILEDFGGERLGRIGLRLLDAPDVPEMLRFQAAFAVAAHLKGAATELLRRLRDDDAEMRMIAAAATRQLPAHDETIIAALRSALDDAEARVQNQAAMSLRMLGHDVPLTPAEEEERNRITALIRMSRGET